MAITPSEWQSYAGAAEASGPGQFSIATPELVAIEFPLAGIGSRFVAVLLDYLLQCFVAAVLIVLAILLLSGTAVGHAFDRATSKWAIAVLIAIPFLYLWGYFTLFEALWRGQTPGKRVMRIRVIQKTGRPISLVESMGRNLLRIVDWLPSAYIIGVICMFVTRQQQRLGDLVAGTLVVHERELETPLGSLGQSRTFTAESMKSMAVVAPPPREGRLPADAAARLTLADLQVLESFFARRLDVPMETRTQLATRLAGNMARKTQLEIPAGMSQETFLEEVALLLRSQQNLRR